RRRAVPGIDIDLAFAVQFEIGTADAELARRGRVRGLRSAGECVRSEGERVDLAPGDQHLVMQMRAGRAPGLADPTDRIALTHNAAGAQVRGEAFEVGVGGLDRAAVLDAYIVAVGAVPAHLDHHAVARGAHLGA